MGIDKNRERADRTVAIRRRGQPGKKKAEKEQPKVASLKNGLRVPKKAKNPTIEMGPDGVEKRPCYICGRRYAMDKYPMGPFKSKKDPGGWTERRQECNQCWVIIRKYQKRQSDAERGLAPPPEAINGEPNPDWFIYKNKVYLNRIERGSMDPAQVREARTMLDRIAASKGIDLTKVEKARETFWETGDLLGQSMAQLEAIAAEIDKVPTYTEEHRILKKKFVKQLPSIVNLVRALQDFCRKNPIGAMLYVDRNQESGQVLKLDPMHTEMCSMMAYPREWAAANGHKNPELVRKVLINAPPGSGKTTAALGIMRDMMCADPRLRTCVVSENIDVARKRVEFVRRMMLNDRIKALYPWVQVDKTKSDTSSRFSLKKDLSVLRQSGHSGMARDVVDSSMEGYGSTSGAQGSEYDRMLLDDPCPKEVREEAATRNRINKAFDDQWDPRTRTFGWIIVIQTRWHDSDLSGVIRKRIQEGDPEWIFKEFSPDCDVSQSGEIAVQKSHCPSRYPISRLQSMADRNPSSFRLLFMHDPTAASVRMVQRLRYFIEEDLVKARREGGVPEHYISVDPADSVGKGGAETGITYWEVFRSLGEAYCVRADRLKRTVDDVAKYVLELRKTHPQLSIVFDAHGQIGSRLHRILKEKIQDNRLIPVSRGPRKKEEALFLAAPYLESGMFKFRGQWFGKVLVCKSNQKWLADQILRFGSTDLFDGVDSVTQFIDHVAKFLTNGLLTGEDKGQTEWVPPWEAAVRKLESGLRSGDAYRPKTEDQRESEFIAMWN